MRQQALFLIAAVTLCASATGQHTYFPASLSLVKTYDIANINKPAIHRMAHGEKQDKENQNRTALTLSPRLNLVNLKSQLGNDMQHLKLERRSEQWQGLFQGMLQNVRRTTPAGNKL